jgi:hypothetical protein
MNRQYRYTRESIEALFRLAWSQGKVELSFAEMGKPIAQANLVNVKLKNFRSALRRNPAGREEIYHIVKHCTVRYKTLSTIEILKKDHAPDLRSVDGLFQPNKFGAPSIFSTITRNKGDSIQDKMKNCVQTAKENIQS